MSVNTLSRSMLRTSLLGWFRSRVDPELRLESLETHGDGASSETWFVTTRTPRAGVVTWVVRVEASGHQIYEDPSIRRQAQVMSTLAEVSSVPVPQVRWLEEDPSVLGAPFLVMEQVDGEAPPRSLNHEGVFFRADESRREAMWRDGVETMARLHKVDVTRFSFLQRDLPGRSVLQRELVAWERYQDWAGVPSYRIFKRARHWLRDNLPASQDGGFAWGDARLGNLMFRGGRCVAALDWETASLAGPESDLAWWLVFDETVTPGPRLPGIGDPAATIALWEQSVGRKAEALPWHEVFAAWRIAMIVERGVALAGDRHVVIGGGVENRTTARLREMLGPERDDWRVRA